MEEQKFCGKKWRRGILVGKRGVPSTPSITWRRRFPEIDPDGCDQTAGNFSTIDESRSSAVSARMLGANLWEALPLFSAASLSKGGGCRGRHRVNASFDEFHGKKSDQPEGASSPATCVVSPHRRHHGLAKRNGSKFDQKYLATNSSSVETASTNSLDFKDKVSSSTGGGLNPSVKLLQVLNQIWKLEEENISNLSLVKSLKIQIRQLAREKERNRLDLDDLAEKFSRLKHLRKPRGKGDPHSLLHHRLLREISEIKFLFSDGFRQLERERKVRLLLEELCDKFAVGIKAYERKIRAMKQVDGAGMACESPDTKIVHVSETWLDGRVGMKLELSDPDLKIDTLSKILSEIESCFRSRRSICSEKEEKLSNNKNTTYLRRNSLESFHLKESASAPRNADEDYSTTDLVYTTTQRRGREEDDGSDDAFLRDKTTHRYDGLGFHNKKESAVNKSLFRDGNETEISESSMKWIKGVKADTLEAKLIEARIEGRKKFIRTAIKGES